MNLLTSRWSPMLIVFCIDPVGTFTACTTNVMPKSAITAVTTRDSKYSRRTLCGGPGFRCASGRTPAPAPSPSRPVARTRPRPPSASAGGSATPAPVGSLLISLHPREPLRQWSSGAVFFSPLKIFLFHARNSVSLSPVSCYNHPHENDGEKAGREGRGVHAGRAAVGARRAGQGLRGRALRLDRAVGVGRRARLPPLPRPGHACTRVRVAEEVVAALDARLRLRDPAVGLGLEDLDPRGARRPLLGRRELLDLPAPLFLRRFHVDDCNMKPARVKHCFVRETKIFLAVRRKPLRLTIVGAVL